MTTTAIIKKSKSYEFMAMQETYEGIFKDEVYCLYGRRKGYADWFLLTGHGIGNQTLEEYINSFKLESLTAQLKEKYKED